MRTIFVAVVAICVLLAAEPAEASRKFVSGADFASQRGSCTQTSRRGNAVVTCGLDEGKRLHYRFRLPRDAHGVHVEMSREHKGCCGYVDLTSTRWGSQRRHLVIEARVRNYGNPLGHFRGIIHRVEVRYRRPLDG